MSKLQRFLDARISFNLFEFIIIVICLGIVSFILLSGGSTSTIAPKQPFVQSFDDVPTDHWAYEEINLIYSYGITVGCSYDPPLYCPDRPATRAEMAVFAAQILEIIEQNH